MFVDRGTNINATFLIYNRHFTAISVAVTLNYVEAVELLLTKMANISGTHGPLRYNALCWVVSNDNEDIVKIVFDFASKNCKGSIYLKDVINSMNENETPLTKASKLGHLNIVNLLLEKGADANLANANGDSPLHIAANERRKEILQHLPGKDAEINRRNKCGKMVLCIATGI